MDLIPSLWTGQTGSSATPISTSSLSASSTKAWPFHYHIRIRENFHVIRHGKESKAHWLFTDLKLGECKHLSGIYYVNGQPCYMSGSKIKDKEGKPELQILVSYCNAEEALDMYRQRWQIETMFKGLKSNGFNIED